MTREVKELSLSPTLCLQVGCSRLLSLSLFSDSNHALSLSCDHHYCSWLQERGKRGNLCRQILSLPRRQTGREADRRQQQDAKVQSHDLFFCKPFTFTQTLLSLRLPLPLTVAIDREREIERISGSKEPVTSVGSGTMHSPVRLRHLYHGRGD